MSYQTLLCVCTLLFLSLLQPHAAATQREHDLELLRDWIQVRGAGPDPLKFKFYEYEGKGSAAEATDNIETGEAVLTIPHELFFNVTSQFKRIFPGLRADNATSTMQGAVSIMHEKSLGSQSSWDYFIKSLPSVESYEQFPFFWDKETVGWFLKSHAGDIYTKGLEEKIRLVDLTKDLCNQINSQLDTRLDCSDTNVKWALCVVSSRSWGAVINGSYSEVLIPYADQFNHDSRKGMPLDMINGRLSAVVDTKRGEELFVNYGPKASSKIAFTYGYLPPQNEWATEISRVFTEKSVFDLSKRQMLDKLGCSNTSSSLLRYKEVSSLEQTIACLRVDNMLPSDLSFILGKRNGTVQVTKMVTLENERRALGQLAQSLVASKKGFTTSAEEDQAMLQRKLSPGMRLAVSLRYHDKVMTDWFLSQLHTFWVNILHTPIAP